MSPAVQKSVGGFIVAARSHDKQASKYEIQSLRTLLDKGFRVTCAIVRLGRISLECHSSFFFPAQRHAISASATCLGVMSSGEGRLKGL